MTSFDTDSAAVALTLARLHEQTALGALLIDNQIASIDRFLRADPYRAAYVRFARARRAIRNDFQRILRGNRGPMETGLNRAKRAHCERIARLISRA